MSVRKAVAVLGLVLMMSVVGTEAQQPELAPSPAASPAPNPVHLELTLEIAATTKDGQPAALRVTLRNAGSLAVDMPLPALDCHLGDGDLTVEFDWHSADMDDLSGYGSACIGGADHEPPLMERVEKKWLRLQPGESMTQTMSLREKFGRFNPGTVDYWVEYSPPRLSKADVAQLEAAGYLPPTEQVKTEKKSFVIR
jgi:hypothetical protein